MSYWETFINEAVGPFDFTLEDGDLLRTFTAPHPSRAAVEALDECSSDVDVLYELLDEDDADEVLDILEDYPVSELQDLVDDIRAHYGLLTTPPYGWATLVKDLDKYGEAVERDLFQAGRDLYAWVRDHEELPWAKLYRCHIDYAPEGSWMEAARLDDDELALEHVKAERQGKVSKGPRRPSLVGWTKDRENAERTVELLEQVLHAVWGASPKFKGKGGKKPGPHPRPDTGYARAKRYALYVEHDEMASMLLGSRYTRKFTNGLWDDDEDALD